MNRTSFPAGVGGPATDPGGRVALRLSWLLGPSLKPYGPTNLPGSMARIEVWSSEPERTPTPGGFGRRTVFETETVRVGETRISPGAHSAWHHHGQRTLYGFVVSGQLTLEFGSRGRESVRPSAGDFFRIPPGLVHRDVNSNEDEAVILNVTVGEGPPTSDVDGPAD